MIKILQIGISLMSIFCLNVQGEMIPVECSTLINEYSDIAEHQNMKGFGVSYQLQMNTIREQKIFNPNSGRINPNSTIYYPLETAPTDEFGYSTLGIYMKGFLSYIPEEKALSNVDMTNRTERTNANSNNRAYPIHSGGKVTNWGKMRVVLNSKESSLVYLDWNDTEVVLEGMNCIEDTTKKTGYITSYFQESSHRTTLVSIILNRFIILK